MAQELEDLLIKVSAECGDLNGIDSAISALSSLADFSQKAQKGAGALLQMANALNGIDKFGKTASGIKKAKDNIDDLITILDKLSKHTGKARESIAQLSLLGKALQNFSGLGTSLKGLDKVVDGINGVVDAMKKLSDVGKSIRDTSNAMSDLSKSMDFSKQSKGAKSVAHNYIQQLKKIREASKQGGEAPSMDISEQINADTAKNIKAIEASGKKMAEAQSKATSFKVDPSKMSAEMKRMGDTISEELAKYDKFLGKQSVGLDLSESVEKEANKTIGTIQRNLAKIKKLRDSAEEVSFDKMVAPKLKSNLAISGKSSSGLKEITSELSSDIRNSVSETEKFASSMKNVATYAEQVASASKSFNHIADTIQRFAESGSQSKSRNERGTFLNFDKDTIAKEIQGAKNSVSLDGLFKEVMGQFNASLHTHPRNEGAFSDADFRAYIGEYLTSGITKNLVAGFKEISSLDFSKVINTENLVNIASQFERNLSERLHSTFKMSVAQLDALTGNNKSFFDDIKFKLVSGIEQHFGEFNDNQKFSDVVANEVGKVIDKLGKDSIIDAKSLSAQVSTHVNTALEKAFGNSYARDMGSLNINLSNLIQSYIAPKFAKAFGVEKADHLWSDTIKNSLKDAMTKYGEDAESIYKSFSVSEYTSLLRKGIVPEDVESMNSELVKLIGERRNIIQELYKTNKELENVQRDLDSGFSASVGIEESDRKTVTSLESKRKALEAKLQEVRASIADVKSQPDFIPQDVQKAGKAYLKEISAGYEEISRKAPNFKNFKFDMGGEKQTDGFDSFREILKLLNDFRETIEKFEGIGQKLEGIKESLKSIYGLIDVLKALSEYTGSAGESIAQLKALGEALQQFGALGVRLNGLEGIQKGIYKMIDVLKLLSEYKGKATQSIAQFKALGEALHSFAELGNNLEGLDSISKGVNKMVDTLIRLSGIEGNAQKSINQLGRLGEALHKFNGLDESLVNLKEISIGLMNLGKATESMKGTSFKDFDYITNIAVALNSFDGVLTGRQFANVAQITSALASLVNALKEAKNINVDSIGAISNAIQDAFGNADFTKSAGKISGVLNSLSKAYGVIATQSGSVRDTMATMVAGFSNASSSLYEVRQNIEAIALDFTDALQPVKNSALFETLEEFKRLNDSYKNVAGLGQGLGTLITSLDSIKGKGVNIKPLVDLLTQLEQLAKDKNIEQLSGKFESLGNIAQPVGYLLNAMKYTDLSGKNNVLSVLADNLTEFYNKINELKGFQGLSWTLNAIKSLVEVAKGDSSFDPENNAITKVAQSLQKFGNLTIPNIADFIKGLTELTQFLIKLPQDVNVNVEPIKQLLDVLQYADSSLRNAEIMLATIRSIKDADSVDTSKFHALNEELNNLIMILGSAPDFNGKAFKDLGSLFKQLSNIKDVNQDQFNLIADGLTKIFNAMGAIQGSNNKISITLDNTGVAKFKEVVEQTEQTYDRFTASMEEGLQHVDISDLFDISKPVGNLKKQLYDAERMYRSTLKKMHSEQEKIDRQIARNPDYQNNQFYQTQVMAYSQLQKKAEQLRDVIAKLKSEIESRPPFETDKQGYDYVKGLRQEYKHLEDTVKRMTKNGKVEILPTTRDGQVLQVIQDRMEVIQGHIQDSFELLQDMEDTEEGLSARANELADAWNRIADEAEKASQEMKSSISEGFGKFSSMLKGSKNGLMSSIGNAGDLFGKMVSDGTLKLSEGTLTSLTKIAGVLGKVTVAVSAVTAVVAIVVEAFKLWWHTMEKVRDAISQFLQKVRDFVKEMLSKVVGAFNAVAGAVSKVVSVVRSGAEAITVALRKIGDVAKFVISIFSKVGSAFAPALKGIKSILLAVSPSFVKTLASSNFQLSKIIKQTHVLKGAIKAITRYFSMLTRMLARKTITAFLNSMKQAFEDMVLFEKNSGDAMLQLNYNVSIVFSALRRLANQVIAIFEPIINAVAVPVQTFLTGLQTMAENMAKFMAILTGQPYYLRAKMFYEDYGQNLEDTEKKAKNLTNALDELNILNDKKDSETTFPNPEDMFEKVDVDLSNFGLPTLKDIIDKIVDFLKNIDWEAIWSKIEDFIDRIMEYVNYILSRLDLAEWLGKTLGDLANTIFVILERLADNFNPKALADWISTFIINALEQIDWDRINRVVEKWATKLAEFWNNIFANEELWDSIVKFITNALNEITHYFEAWARTFDFAQMAQQLTDSIASVLNNYNWEQLRQAVENWVGGLVTFINTAIANKEFWKSIGQAIENTINNVFIEALKNIAQIDLVGFSDSLKTAIQNAIDGIKWDDFTNSVRKIATDLANALNNFFGDEQFLTQITTAIANFANTIIWAIDDFIKSLKAYDIAKAISNALQTGLGTIDWETIFRLPADAINALSQALKGLLDSLPKNFNLGTWLTEHLEITLDNIDWVTLEEDIRRFGQQISNFISGVLQNQEFWAKAGKATGIVLRIGLNFIFDIFSNINGEDLGNAIANYVNNLISEVNIGKYISKTITIAIKILTAINVALTGINWSDIGKQIGDGIVDAINQVYANRDLIRKTIENAFKSVSTVINEVLVKMIDAKSFYKLGQIIGEIALGIINGISMFFDMNKDEIIKAMKDFTDGLAKFISDNEDKIVEGLNNIIDGIVDIIDAFFDEKAKLWQAINKVIERLNIGKLIGSFVRNFLIKILGKLKNLTAISDALYDTLDEFAKEVAEALKKWGKYFVDRLKHYLFSDWKPIQINLGEWVADLLLGKKDKAEDTKFDLSSLFGKFEFTGLKNLWEKIKGAWEKAKETVKGWAKNLGDFFGGIFGKKKEVEVPIDAKTDVNVDVDDKIKLEDLVDKDSAIELEFEDASLGKIKAKTIEVEIFKPKTINTEEIYAEVLYVTDIIADKLKVKEIETNTETNGKEVEQEKLYAGNKPDVLGGTLTNPAYDKITAKILEITEKIIAPLLEIAERITVPIVEVDKKIKTPLLEVKKKITTPLLEVLKKTLTPLLEVTSKITTPLLEAFTITATLLTVPTINSDNFNVTTINSQLLNVADIVAGTLRVGEIDGSLGSGIVDRGIDDSGNSVGFGSFGNLFGLDDLNLEKPQFEVGERWSDISGLIPSAEDFLDGLSTIESSISGGKLIPQYLADNSSGVAGGVLTNGLRFESGGSSNSGVTRLSDFDKKMADTLAGAKIHDLPSNAEYIRDYLMSFIGNESGVYGLMGNLYAESKLKANNLQDIGNEGVTQRDLDYTKKANANGSSFIKDNKGYGLAQWTTPDRKEAFYKSLNGRSVDDLDAQLEFLKAELMSPQYKNVLDKLRNAKSIEEASDATLYNFEKPKNKSEAVAGLRLAYSQDIAGQLGSYEGDTPNIDANEDIPKNDRTKENFDELSIEDDNKKSSIGSTGFLGNLIPYTEYTMAYVYNIIDTWLGRIWKLLESFDAPNILEELVSLGDINFGDNEVFKEISEHLEELIDVLNKLLEDGIKCNCDCQCGDNLKDLGETLKQVLEDCGLCGDHDTHLDNNTKAKSANTKAVEDNNKILKDLMDSGIGGGCKGSQDVVDAINRWIDCAGNTGHLDNNTNAKSKNTKAVEDNTKAIMNLIHGGLGNVTCNCNCNCNCGSCAMGNKETSSGEHVIKDPVRYAPNDLEVGSKDTTPTRTTPTHTTTPTPSNSYPTGRSGYTQPTDKTQYGRGGGSPYPYIPNYPSGKTGTTGSSGSNGGKNIIWKNANGSKASMFANINGQMIRITDDLSNTMKELIKTGKYIITDSVGNKLNNKDFSTMIKFLKNRWKDTPQEDDRWKNYYLQRAGEYEKQLVYAIVDGKKIQLSDFLDPETKLRIANGIFHDVELFTEDGRQIIGDNQLDKLRDILIAHGWTLGKETDALEDATDAIENLSKDIGEIEKSEKVENLPNYGNGDIDARGGKIHVEDRKNEGVIVEDNKPSKPTPTRTTPVPSGGKTIPENYSHEVVEGHSGWVQNEDNSGGNSGSGNSGGGSGSNNYGEENTSNNNGGGNGSSNVPNGVSDGTMRSSWGVLMPKGTYEKDGVVYNPNGSELYISHEKLAEREKEQREKAQKAQEEYAQKQKEARQALSDSQKAVVPHKENEDKADEWNNQVEQYRSEAKSYLDNILAHGTEDQKRVAQQNYESLMFNHAYATAEPYRVLKENLKNASLNVDAKVNPQKVLDNSKKWLDEILKNDNISKAQKSNAQTLFNNIKWRLDEKSGLHEDDPKISGFYGSLKALYDDVKNTDIDKMLDTSSIRIGMNGGISTYYDGIKKKWSGVSDSLKASLASVIFTDKDTKSNKAYFYLGRDNSNQAVTDENIINKIKERIKKQYGITDDDNPAKDKKETATATSSPVADTSTTNATDEKAKSGSVVENIINAIANDVKVAMGSGSGKKFTEFSSQESPISESDVNDYIMHPNKLTKFKAGDIATYDPSEAKSAFDNWYQRFLTKGYQLGGMPNAGEIFVARENGTPEFVGAFGNKTAVANNDQIVTAVANGVSMANDRMVNAIQSQTDALENAIDRKNLDVQIGDRQIAEANRRGEQGLGQSFIK